MNKIVRVRILLPVYMFVYMLLGGWVVPYVDRPIGHLIVLILDVGALALLIFTFYRYDTQYRNASAHRLVFNSILLSGIGVVGLVVYHIVAIVSQFSGLLELFTGELFFLALELLAWLVYVNSKSGPWTTH